MSVIPLLEGCYTKPVTSTNSNELLTERIIYPGASGEMKAYVARPKKVKNILLFW